MSTTPSSRLDSARRRLRVARYAIGALAAAAFAGGIAAARAAHPATHSSHATRAVSAGTLDAPPSFRDAETQAKWSFGFDGGSSISPAPSTSAPAVQSGGS